MWDFLKALFTGEIDTYIVDVVWPFIQAVLETIFLAFLLVPITLIKIVRDVVGIFAGTHNVEIVTTTYTDVPPADLGDFDFSHLFDRGSLSDRFEELGVTPIRDLLPGSLGPRSLAPGSGTAAQGGGSTAARYVAERTTEETTILEYFFNQPFITRAFWGVTLIALAVCIGFSILAVIRSMGDLQQNRPLGKVLSSIGKAMLTFLIVPFMCISAIMLVTVVMRQTDELFRGAAIYGEEVSVEGAMLISAVQPEHVRMWDVTTDWQYLQLENEEWILLSTRPGGKGADANLAAFRADPRYRKIKAFSYAHGNPDRYMGSGDRPAFHAEPNGTNLTGGKTMGGYTLEEWLGLTSEDYVNYYSRITYDALTSFLKDEAQLDSLGEGVGELAAQIAQESRTNKSISDHFSRKGLLIHEFEQLGQERRYQMPHYEAMLTLSRERDAKWKATAIEEYTSVRAYAEIATAFAETAKAAYEAAQAALDAWALETDLSAAFAQAAPGVHISHYLTAEQQKEYAELLLLINNARQALLDAEREMYIAIYANDYAIFRLFDGPSPVLQTDARDWVTIRQSIDRAFELSPGLEMYNIAIRVTNALDELIPIWKDQVADADNFTWFCESVCGHGVREVVVRTQMEFFDEGARMMLYDRLIDDYMFGRRGVTFKDMYNIRYDFNVFSMFFGGIGIFSIVAAWFIVLLLLMVVLVFIRRIFEVVVLYIVSPFFVSTIPIDDGKRFGGWRDMFVSRLLAGYGSIFTLNVFLLMLPMIWSPSLTLSSSNFVNNLLKLIFMAGGVYTVWKSHTLISQIINPQAAAAEQESAGGVMALGGMALGAGMAAMGGGAKMAMGVGAGIKNSFSGGSGGSGGSSDSSPPGSGNKNPNMK